MIDEKPTMQTLVSQYADLHQHLREEDSYALLWLLLQDGSVMSALKKRVLIDYVLTSIGTHTPDQLHPVLDFIEELEFYSRLTANPAYWHLMTTDRLIGVHCLIGRDGARFIPSFIRDLIPTGVRLVASRQQAAEAWMAEAWAELTKEGDLPERTLDRWTAEALATGDDTPATGDLLSATLKEDDYLNELFQTATKKRQLCDGIQPRFDSDGTLMSGAPVQWVGEMVNYKTASALLHEYMMAILGMPYNDDALSWVNGGHVPDESQVADWLKDADMPQRLILDLPIGDPDPDLVDYFREILGPIDPAGDEDDDWTDDEEDDIDA